MLDENKITNRRNKIKKLLLQHSENQTADIIPCAKIQSCHHPVKIIFMGVVVLPILLKRVSKKHKIKDRRTDQQFQLQF